MTRVALTGATGFVGAHLAEALRARGDEVVCLARRRAAHAPLLALGCAMVEGGLEDEAALDRLVEGAEVVYHVAGAISARSEDEFRRANRDGTARVAAAARRAGAKRLLYVSSLAVTGPSVPGRPLDESVPPRPVTPYGRSKRDGEEVVRAAGVPFTIVRPPVVYGPGDRQVLRLFRMARRGFAPLVTGGVAELSVVYGPDLALALVAAATRARTEGGTYHAGHARPVSTRSWIEAIGTALGRRVHFVPVPRALVPVVLTVTGAVARLGGQSTLLDRSKEAEILAPAWTCASDALERDAGWQAATDLPEGLARTARWYRDAGWL